MSLFGASKRAIKVVVFGKTDVGKSRDHNEDCFLVADLTRKRSSLLPEVREHEIGDRGSLFMVADGMGGAAAGELASQIATDVVYTHLTERWVGDPDNSPNRFAHHLKEAVEVANSRIHAYAKDHPEVRGMGTTTTAAGILSDHLYLSQIGDSRGYLIRNGTGHQLTKDQSLMQRLVEAGELTEEEAAKSDRRNIILQALGPDPKVKVDLTHQPVRRGDKLVLCSDGLSGLVKKEEIAEVVTRTRDLTEACTKLIAMANERGGPDNITVVIVQFDGDGLKAPDSSEEEVGYQIYPLIDTESSTEPVPVYKGSKPPTPRKAGRGRLLMLLGVLVVTLAIAAWVLLTP